ncbi:hypothetical protein P7C73_g5001, partial [Tremellales sp. Uapishka_1]
MPRCTNKGCLQDFEEADNAEGSCSYHSGGPVFHEGLKSWSCCNENNKPVMEFDAFMAIPTCTTGKHSTAAPPKAAPTTEAPSVANLTISADGVETYGAPAAPPLAPTNAPIAAAPAVVKVEEEDDLSLPVPEGATCKRLGCGSKYEGEVSRGTGDKATCTYHPQPAIFHEGSKGYLCCKRRVLEFSEFLNIPGCKEGRHLFVGAKKDEIHLDLHLPGNKRVVKSIELYGAIVPSTSTFRILSTKVDIVLQKPSASSWPVLELPAAGSELPPGYALTFGVSGRTGTVGGKEIVLAPEEMAKRG